MPLTLRFLGNEMFAVWSYVSIFAGMFGFADMGLGVTVGRYIGVALGRNDHASVRSYWGTGNAVMLPFLAVVSLLFTGLGAWLGPQWFKVSSANVDLLRWCFAAGGLGLFLNYYATYWLVLSQAHLDFKFVSVLRTGTNLASVIPSIFIAWLTHNPFYLIAWSVLVSFFQLAIFVLHARKKYDLGFDLRAASVARLREMSAYVGKTFLNLMAGSLFAGIDRVILGKLALPVLFNPYIVASNMAARLQSLSVATMGPVFFNTSRVAEGGQQSAAKIYDEVFTFLTDWYLLAALWIGLWHPVLLRVWLSHTLGPGLWPAMAHQVAPLLMPLVIACCITSLANISAAQLTPLNRVGATIGFTVAAGLLAIAGVWAGWHQAGVVGSAYGFLFSRGVYLAQDLFTIRLIRARGWINPKVWLKAGAQVLVSAALASAYFIFPPDSYWLLPFAALHAGLVAAWLLRQPLQKIFTR
jgi:O-antigen/teichoic acid export membrane protein